DYIVFVLCDDIIQSQVKLQKSFHVIIEQSESCGMDGMNSKFRGYKK
ncbi:9554_t:CDS:1, partial [Dentiscutata heterogama]